MYIARRFLFLFLFLSWFHENYVAQPSARLATYPSPDDIGDAEKPVMWARADMEIPKLSTFLGPYVQGDRDKMPPLHFHIKRRRWAES